MSMNGKRVVVLLNAEELAQVRAKAGLVPLSAWFRSLAIERKDSSLRSEDLPQQGSVRVAGRGTLSSKRRSDKPMVALADGAGENHGRKAASCQHGAMIGICRHGSKK